MSKQITVDLKKVQWATYHWINGKGDERKTMPDQPTVNGVEFNRDEMVFGSTESMYALALQRGLLDIWKPVCRLHITANRTLTFVGDKATSIWKAYNKHIYGRK